MLNRSQYESENVTADALHLDQQLAVTDRVVHLLDPWLQRGLARVTMWPPFRSGSVQERGSVSLRSPASCAATTASLRFDAPNFW